MAFVHKILEGGLIKIVHSASGDSTLLRVYDVRADGARPSACLALLDPPRAFVFRPVRAAGRLVPDRGADGRGPTQSPRPEPAGNEWPVVPDADADAPPLAEYLRRARP